MPSILNPGALQPNQGGLFGSYSVPAGGIFSALKDVAGYLGGGGSTDNFAQYNAQNQQAQMRQQLLQGLTSEDPAMRSQAYSTAALLGIDTKPFQQQQAAQALPKLLQSMQPSTQTVSAMPAPLPMGPQFAPQTMDYQKPGANLSDALAQSGSPELQAQYLPQLLQSKITQDAKAAEPFTLKDGEHRFVGGVDVANLPEKNNPNQPFNPDGSPNLAYQKYMHDQKAFEQGPAWANVDIARKNAETKAAGSFTSEEGALMGALAERGVSLPTGFRSKEQQKTLYQGILARNPDKSPDEIADLIKKGTIELGAQKKETQTAAGVAGKVEVAQNEMEEFVPLVRQAAAKVPRGNFIPLTKLLQMGDSSISDPNLKVLKGRINALMNAYDMLAARGGTDKDKRAHVHELLTSADGPEALNAQLDNFEIEAAAAHRAAVKATKVPELAPAAAPNPRAAGSTANLPRLPTAPKIRVFNPATGRLE